MYINRPWNGAANVKRILHQESSYSSKWFLRWKPICSSTENELKKWLAEDHYSSDSFKSVISARQNYGKGQKGRTWSSKIGGVWLSAALPIYGIDTSMELFGLASALALSQTIESFGVIVKIKWPNDLMILNRKVAGFLPTLHFRGGDLRLVRIGVGLNISNRAPQEGISLSNILSNHRLDKDFWTAQVLISLERSIKILKNKRFICEEVQKRFWTESILDRDTGDHWEIGGLHQNGGLKLINGNQLKVIRQTNYLGFY